MVRVYEVDGLDVVDKFKRNSGPNGFKRNKKHSGQRVSAINWRNSYEMASLRDKATRLLLCKYCFT